MLRRRLAIALAVLLAAPAAARAQEEPEKAPAPSAPAQEVDTQVDVRGSRFEVKLVHGSRIQGVLPQGKRWERLDADGEYEECAETDKGSGIRLYYVLGLEGDIFIRRQDITELRDLGALTEEQVRAIRDQVIAQRKKVIEEREKALREELRRMAEEKKAQEARSAEETGRKKAEEKAATEVEVQKGEELLKKFPPEEWSEQRAKDVLHREIVNGIFRNAEEREFIDNLKAWKAALARRAAEEEKPAPDEGGGETPPKKEPPPKEEGK
jgi:hypothetical protein